jgi:hypothetical protein
MGMMPAVNPKIGEYGLTGKSFVAGWITFIHRQQALVAGNQRPCSIY